MNGVRKILEEFIEEAKQIYGNKYDYSLVEYKNAKTKVKIICPKHGMFLKTPDAFLNKKSDCPECRKKNTKQFIEEAKQIHGSKYDYSLTKYIGCNTKVKIICPVHGVFEQTPNNHLKGHGCTLCSSRAVLTLKEFIQKANLVHNNKYNYSLTNYKNAEIKVKIICPVHGVFEQTPNNHLKGNGCPKCFKSKGEKIIEIFLQKNNIKYVSQKKFKNLKDKSFLSYDFYIPDKKTLIEYNGIQHYYKTAFNKGYKKFLIQKHHDWLKRKYARDNGYKLLVIPHWNFNNIETILEENL